MSLTQETKKPLVAKWPGGIFVYRLSSALGYGWTVGRIMDVAHDFVMRPTDAEFVPERYSVVVYFDDNGRVNYVFCPSEGIDLR